MYNLKTMWLTIHSTKKIHVSKKQCFFNLNLVKGLIALCFFLILFIPGWSQSKVVYAAEEPASGSVLHAFYPAFAVYSEKIQEYIDNVDSLSFAWSMIEAADPGTLNITRGQNKNVNFYYPKDYLQPVRYAKSHGKSIQLNIYMKGSDCTKLLPYEEERGTMIQGIIDFIQQDISEGEGLYYDGVVIDFEGLRDTDSNKQPILYDGEQISTYFIQFLTDLKEQLDDIGKSLFVAVNSRLNYDGFDYQAILEVADRVILMAHDYEPTEKLTKAQVQQYTGYTALNPISSPSPIHLVRKALNDMQDSASDENELSKVWLQLCFDSAQWKFDVNGPEEWDKLAASSLSRKGRVVSLYQAIKDRVDNKDKNGQNLTYGYNNAIQSPYIQYYNTSDQSWNVILYEDSNSLAAKIELAKTYGLGGISVWSLANLPDYEDSNGKKYHLDGWSTILEEMSSFDILPEECSQTVSFSDAAIEKTVREKLGKLTGDLTVYEVNQIYRLKLSSGVNSLMDLRNLKNLEYLDASQLNITDITPLQELTKLKVLYLQRNQITDISPLSKLKKLEVLSLNGNQISSLKPLSALSELRELYLRENKIESIAALANLNKLNVLELGMNQIKKLDEIAGLKKLKQLSVENNKLIDIKGLKALTGLRYLNLSNNQITDIQYISKMTGLEQLYLQRNSITDMKALENMKLLKELSLNGNKISDLKPLTKLVSLQKLYLTENNIKSITPLKGLINLKELYLAGNSITDYSPVKGFYSNLNANCDFRIK